MWKGKYRYQTYYGLGYGPRINWADMIRCLEMFPDEWENGVTDTDSEASDFELLLPLELM